MDPEPEAQPLDNSHQLDSVTIFSSSNHDAEMEALEIHSLLEANGIQSLVIGPSTIPVLEFQVTVARTDVAEARHILEEARAAGSDAAFEAEAASEEQP
jgi:citrate lyase beta subunit